LRIHENLIVGYYSIDKEHIIWHSNDKFYPSKKSHMTILSKPFLKWAGGKSKLVPILSEHLGVKGRLVEPFVGSGSVFMGTDFNDYLLCDSNPDLIGLFNNLKHYPKDLILQVNDIFDGRYNNEKAFYELRSEFNQLSSESLRKSVLFVYLNKHAFNGLCRYNSKGFFNVPYGRYSSPTAPIREMELFSEKSKRAEFICTDFSKTFAMVKEGDVVYCDPPYVPLSSSSNFTAYSKGAFNNEHQECLAKLAESCKGKNIKVVISNHDTDFTRRIYSTAVLHELDVHRSISSKSSTRGKVGELIAVYE
jgi:DNA adenine methylase